MSRRDPDETQDILDIIPERFDADPDSTQARRGARLRLALTAILGLAALVAMGAAGWHIFFSEAPRSAQQPLPVIKADQAPIKTRPEDRGGMEVPNQDKLVYDRMGTGDNNQTRMERLLPPPEVPKSPPASPAKPKMESLGLPRPGNTVSSGNEPPPGVAAPVPPVVSEPIAPPAAPAGKLPDLSKAEPAKVEPAKPPAKPPATVKMAQAEPAKPVAKAEVAKPGPEKLTPEKPTPEKPTPDKRVAVATPPAPVHSSAGGMWMIQIAAMKTRETAEQEWAAKQKANSDLLGGMALDVVQVDLGDKGVFYRVRTGPLDQGAARALCDQLGKRKIGCMVVHK